MRQAGRAFACRGEEVGAARRFAHDVLWEWGLESESVVLVVNELAANAVIHTQGGFSLYLCCSDGGGMVTIEVTDPSTSVPFLPPSVTEADATSGRGMTIVDRLSSEWGTRPLPGGGKTVWANVADALH